MSQCIQHKITKESIQKEILYPCFLFDVFLGTDHLISGGGGAGIFPRDKLFFSLFLCNKLFFQKQTATSFFLKNNTFKSEKCKQKQHIE